MNFGEKLKDLRTQKGWSQEELAKQMGVTRRTIGGYEAGTTYPRTRDMYAKPVSYTHLDVYKRQDGAWRRRVDRMLLWLRRLRKHVQRMDGEPRLPLLYLCRILRRRFS